MSKNILKVIYDNGEEETVKDFKTVEQIKTSYTYDKDWQVNNHYERQFRDLERKVLAGIDDDIITSYAKDNLSLKNEDDNDCDCPDSHISDFEDEELVAELLQRNINGFQSTSIMNVDFVTRFCRIISLGSNQELEEILSDLETKYNL